MRQSALNLKIARVLLVVSTLQAFLFGRVSFARDENDATENSDAASNPEAANNHSTESVAFESSTVPEESAEARNASEELSRVAAIAPPSNERPGEQPEGIAQDLMQAIDNPETLTVEHVNSLGIRALTLGHRHRLEQYIESVIERISLPGDNLRYRVELIMDRSPNGSFAIDGTRLLKINIGLLGLIKNEDELAYFLAHEITHGNPNQATILGNFTKIDQAIVSGTPNHPVREGYQREELRADLGAMERIIRAGYNPWAGYNFLQSSDKVVRGNLLRSAVDAVTATHPASELRMVAMKAYFLQESQTRNLSEQTARTHPLPSLVSWLRPRITALDTYVGTRNWIKDAGPIGIAASAILTAVAGLFKLLPWAAEGFRIWLHGIFELYGYDMQLLFGYTASQIREALHEPLISGALVAALTARVIFNRIQAAEEKYQRSRPLREQAMDVVREVRRLFVRESFGTRPRLDDYFSLVDEIASFARFNRDIQRVSFVARDRAAYNGIDLSRKVVFRATDFLISRLERQFAVASNETIRDFANQMNRILAILPMDSVTIEQRGKLDGLGHRVLGSLLMSDKHQFDIRSWLEESARLKTVEVAEKNRDGLAMLRALHEASSRPDWSNITEAFFHRNYDLIADAVFSRENPDIEWVDKFRKLHLSRFNARNDLGVPELYTLRQSREGAQWLDRLTIMTHTVALPVNDEAKSRRIGALLDGINRKDTQEIIDYFETQIHSVAELDHFITHEAIPRRMNLRTLEPVFYVLIDRHKEWIKDTSDVAALVRQDHFWPKSNDPRVRAYEQTGSFLGDARSIGLASLDNDFLGAVVSRKQEYDLALSERLHLRVREALHGFGAWPKPQNLNQSRKLWQLLVTRGVTPVTDDLIFATHRAQPASRQQILENDALGPPRMIWDEAAHARLVEEVFRRKPAFQGLNSGSLPLDSAQRRLRIQQLMSYLNTQMPDRGAHYQSILERLSRDIRSSERESALIMNWRRLQQTRSQQDRYARYFSGLVTEALSWSSDDQWALVRFLRGENVPNATVNDAFARIGPARVRQAYEGLPIEAKTAFLDSLLDGSSGMLHIEGGNKKSAKKVETNTHTIVDYLLRDSDSGARAVAGELMESFLHSLTATGNAPLRSSTLAYLLAQPAGSTDSGEVLKRVLENFGTAGVKIGQFLVASGTLPSEITRALRSLQDKAREPARGDIYRDLREILEVPAGVGLPYVIGDLLGAASVKYAVSATDRSTGKRVVLKVLRREAISHTEQEFKQLNAMAEFLEVRHGSRYGVFRSIIRASHQAVNRELNLANELRRGEVAGRIYQGRDRGNISFQVPKERLINPRLIEAEFIPGKSINDLEPAHKIAAARAISETEWQNFHQPDATTGEFIFCPDRHPGNYRIHVEEAASAGQEPAIRVGVIDFGQLVEGMPQAQRQNILEIFAHSQALKVVGSNGWIVKEIGQTLGLNASQTARLREKLRGYFPARNAEPVGAYFSLLAALEDAGAPQSIEFYDYVRGVIQTHPYQEMAKLDGDSTHATLRTAEGTLDSEVRSRAKRIERDIELTPAEKASYAWREFMRWYRGEATVPLEGGDSPEASAAVGAVAPGAACRPERLAEVMQRVMNSPE